VHGDILIFLWRMNRVLNGVHIDTNGKVVL